MADHGGNLVALCHFDSREYGYEYLELLEGDIVEILCAPSGEPADQDWSYGRVEGRGEGWFPTDFIRLKTEVEDITEPMGVLEDEEVNRTHLMEVARSLAMRMKIVEQARLNGRQECSVAHRGFHAIAYGGKSLGLRECDIPEILDAPTREPADQEWSYGTVKGRAEGWFPTQSVRLEAEVEDTTLSMKVLADEEIHQKRLIEVARSLATRMGKVEQTRNSLSQGMANMQPLVHVALGDFHAKDYGAEYVSLYRGAQVELLHAEASDEEWSYGNVSGHGVGWFPTQFIWRVWLSWTEMNAEIAKMHLQSTAGQEQYKENEKDALGSPRIDEDGDAQSPMGLDKCRQNSCQSELSCIVEKHDFYNIEEGDNVKVESGEAETEDRQIAWYLHHESNCEDTSEEVAADSFWIDCCSKGAENRFEGTFAQSFQRVFIDSEVARRIRGSEYRLRNEWAWNIAFPPLLDGIAWLWDRNCISCHLHALGSHCDGLLSPRVWRAMHSVSRRSDKMLMRPRLDVLSRELRCDAVEFANVHEAAVFRSLCFWMQREGHANLWQALDPCSGGDFVPIGTTLTTECLHSKPTRLSHIMLDMMEEFSETQCFINGTADKSDVQQVLSTVTLSEEDSFSMTAVKTANVHEAILQIGDRVAGTVIDVKNGNPEIELDIGGLKVRCEINYSDVMQDDTADGNVKQ